MNVEELMTPRVEVSIDYPDSPYRVGDILRQVDGAMGMGVFYEPEKDIIVINFPRVIERYPHIFRRMNWWEKQELSDLPKYVKSGSEIFKVARWGQMHIDLYSNINAGKIVNDIWIEPLDPLPATEQEYLDYTNK